ncbi:unnamed protein product [Rotaria sp. Silwood1]|nr:unnamed protein product [Rotaria sp. Silwood1]CAF3639832.1 unnamed protein product [Rotaria sp. Silwood1]CAF3707574.1 unnamed protein product [Rotaria sp. Silwood1]CAF3728444.1 unnamed protein product [Rotaria sp. Silwood1]CAF4905280.1 unnamed protein product [Rotaria sp. Silwood1]
MSNLCRLVPRTTTNVLYVSRMNAHNLLPGSSVKIPEAKNEQPMVSGAGQFIATNGPSITAKTGIGGGGSSESMLPSSETAHDKTNPNKTTGDAKASESQGGPDKAHESILKSPLGQFGLVALTAISVYAGYKMLFGNSPNQKANFEDIQARITRPDLQPESAVHAKIAQDENPHKPHEGVKKSNK